MALNKTLLSLLLLLAVFGPAAAWNCSCPKDQCCNNFGYCGTGDAYCSGTCQQGSCASSGSGGGALVSDIVTDAFFNGIIGQADSSCAGKNFYTRAAFLAAARSNPQFGTAGDSDTAKREIAAFFAHVTYETGSFCYIEEINGASNSFCDSSNTRWPCSPGKSYYGRGPLQISWNFNYGPAGASIGFDGLNAPETVAKDATISFKTALWLWMNNVHSVITGGQGFGATIRAINSIECNGSSAAQVKDRVKLFTQYCQQLGVSTGDNLTC